MQPIQLSISGGFGAFTVWLQHGIASRFDFWVLVSATIRCTSRQVVPFQSFGLSAVFGKVSVISYGACLVIYFYSGAILVAPVSDAPVSDAPVSDAPVSDAPVSDATVPVAPLPIYADVSW
jgi:hypothetical protein